MNIAVPLITTLVLFGLAYWLYSGFIARAVGLDPLRQTPSVTKRDGVDFVPTQLGVVFSHHFASIAGGGPILGPTLALIYGYGLPLVWIILGCILIGAVHDFTALFVSVREDGRSMAEVTRKVLGETGFFLFIAFTVLSLLMVIVSFLGATVAALTSTYPLDLLGLGPDQTILRTVVENGVVKGRIGGIASTSVFVITGLAPLVGYLLYVKKVKTWIMALTAMAICFGSIGVGVHWPVAISPSTWRIVLCIYILLAAGIPVWIILQPRDFTNSFILYAGIVLIATAILVGGVNHFFGQSANALFTVTAPAWNTAEGSARVGAVWPILFITVACGAISGFHSLVAGGTSSKQVCNEKHIRVVGYGGMLLEGVLAVGVLTVVASGISFDQYREILFPSVSDKVSNPILAFALALGSLLDATVRIPKVYGTIFGILLVEGFVVTTLDTSVRLCRYLLEELWTIVFTKVPKVCRSYLFNAGLVVAVSYVLALTNSITKVWPIFGSANQVLAALVLIVIAVWLTAQGKPSWFATVPAGFMLVTTVASLGYLLVTKYVKAGNVPLMVADALLLILALGFLVMLVRRFRQRGVTAATIV